MMDLKEAIALLHRYNEWRRGAEQEMENPADIGIAIDCVLDAVENQPNK
jgi:hypothetical protein